MLNRVRLILLIPAGVLLATLGVACLSTVLVKGRPTVRPKSPPQDMLTNINQPLPTCRLTDFKSQEVAADELRRGRVLFVYLATGCTACVKEAEIISRLRRDAPPGLRIYGVSAESDAQLARFAEEVNLSFPMLRDAKGQLADSLDTKYYPSKYFVENGLITKIWYGTTRDEGELRRQLDVR